MHFVWLDSVTRPVNSVNIFLINLNIVLDHVIFIKYLWLPKISIVSIELKSTEKKFTTPFNPVFSKLVVVKSFECYLNTVNNLLFLSFLLWIDILL